MSLYPTLEELKVAGLLEGQDSVLRNLSPQDQSVYAQAAGYMGLRPESVRFNDHGELMIIDHPECPIQPALLKPADPVPPAAIAVCAAQGPTAIIPSTAAPGQIKQGVRRLILCKDGNGKVGVQLRSVDTGIFVSLVTPNSPAALGGLRFGDQILSINDVLVAGFTGPKAMDLLRKAGKNNINVVVRDRPFERTVQLHKGSGGDLGMSIDHGLIRFIHKDSSAARNGMLTNHQIVEVNGQNVLGIKDKQLRELIERTPDPVNITILPIAIHKHIIKNLSKSQLRQDMDRSCPDV